MFRSETQLRLLGLVLLNAGRRWTTAELSGALDAPAASVHRELRRAVDAGLILEDDSARPHRFEAANESPVAAPTRALLEATIGVELELRHVLGETEGVDAAVIFGSWAAGRAGPASDIDVLVVGDVDRKSVRRMLADVGRHAGRTVDSVLWTREEFRRRQRDRDRLLGTLDSAPTIGLVGEVGSL